MRTAPLLLLALAACSGQSAQQESAQQAPETTNAATPATPAKPVTTNGSNLTGAVSGLSADTSGLSVRVTDTRVIVELPADTLFEFDSADIDPAAETNLAKVADLIRAAPAGTIEITGYTDARGDVSYNQPLSERRAQSVANWLRDKPGLHDRQYQVVGRGEASPVAPNTRPDGSDDPAGRARNRRVEVSIPR